MRDLILLGIVLATSALVACGAPAPDKGTGTAAPAAAALDCVIPLEMVPVSRKVLAKATATVSAGDGSAPHAVEVRLTHAVYHARIAIYSDGKRTDSALDLHLYELRPTLDTELYGWTLWTGGQGHLVDLFVAHDGEPYLTCVNGPSVEWMSAQEPITPCMALAHMRDRARHPATLIPSLRRCLPGVDIWGGRDVNANVKITDVKREGAGNWLVTVRVLHTGQEYTLVGQGDNWQKQ